MGYTILDRLQEYLEWLDNTESAYFLEESNFQIMDLLAYPFIKIGECLEWCVSTTGSITQ